MEGDLWKPCSKESAVNDLRLFRTTEPEGIDIIGNEGEWIKIDMALDSGATETVVGEQMVGAIETKEKGNQSKVWNMKMSMASGSPAWARRSSRG